MVGADEDDSFISAGAFLGEDTNDSSMDKATDEFHHSAEDFPGNVDDNAPMLTGASDTNGHTTDIHHPATPASDESCFLWECDTSPSSVPNEDNEQFQTDASPPGLVADGSTHPVDEMEHSTDKTRDGHVEDGYLVSAGSAEACERTDVPAPQPDQSQTLTENEQFHTPPPASIVAMASPVHLGTELRAAVLSDCDQTLSAAVADPFAAEPDGANVVLFGSSPLSGEELVALQRLADKNSASPESEGALSSLVKRLFETVRFQREELRKVKRDEVDLANEAVDEERRRHSALERRRSYAMDRLGHRVRSLQQDLDDLRKEHAQCGVYASQQAEYAQSLETELESADNAMTTFLTIARRADPQLQEDATPELILSAVESLLPPTSPVLSSEEAPDSPRVAVENEAEPSSVDPPQLSLEEYGQRLLELERVLKASEDHCEVLVQENTDLQVRILKLEGQQSVPVSPASAAAPSPVAEGTAQPVRQDVFEYQETVVSLRSEVDKLQDECSRLKRERQVVEGDVLHLQVSIDKLSSKLADVQSQRAAAVEERRRGAEQYSSLMTKYQAISKELSEITVSGARDLAESEAQCGELRSKVADQERALAAHVESASHMSGTVKLLESELLEYSTSLASRVKEVPPSRALVEGAAIGVIEAAEKNIPHGSKEAKESPATPAAGQHSLKVSPNAGLIGMRDEFASLNGTISDLREECEHWKREASMLREDLGLARRPEEAGDSMERPQGVVEDGLLRRLSACLGYPDGVSSRELIEKLVQRVENLVTERGKMEESIEGLQGQIVDRQRYLNLIRSEFMAEISALKAELAHVENDRARAVADREAAEVRFLEAAKRDEESTLSHAGDETNHSMFGFEEGGQNGREWGDGDETWEDPSVRAAIESLNVLIGRKDTLAARNKALLDRLNKMIQESTEHRRENGGSPSSRAVALESRSVHEELVGIVSLQQKVIRKLRSRVSSGASRRASEADNRSDILESKSPLRHEGREDNSETRDFRYEETVARASTAVGRRQSVAQHCSEFLREQLSEMRDLCNRRAKANNVLHGVVREMESEIERVSGLRDAAEEGLNRAQAASNNWVSRLSIVANVPATKESIESFVTGSVSAVGVAKAAQRRSQAQYLITRNWLGQALAQKRFLAYLISTYQSKYQLDILAPVGSGGGQKGTGVSRIRRIALAVVAVIRVRRLAANQEHEMNLVSSTHLDLDKMYGLPKAVSLVSRGRATIALESAVLALQALPKLERALHNRGEEIASLRASIAALEVRQSAPLAEVSHNQVAGENLFDYNDDMLERKNDLARRLRKALKQREELSERYAREKREKQDLEARISKYMEKLSSYQRRLGRVKNEADARDRTYKAAIRYLKTKADNAVEWDETALGDVETRALLYGNVGQENLEEPLPSNKPASKRPTPSRVMGERGVSSSSNRGGVRLSRRT